MRFLKRPTSKMDGSDPKRITFLLPFRRMKRTVRKIFSVKNSSRTEKESELGSSDGEGGGSSFFLKPSKRKQDQHSDSESFNDLDISFQIQNKIDNGKSHKNECDTAEINSQTDGSGDLSIRSARTSSGSIRLRLSSGSMKQSGRRESERVELLAMTRTPSFNVMVHANELYSDTSTLVTRSSLRITWEDLQNACPNVDEADENDQTESSENNGDGIFKTVTFQNQEANDGKKKNMMNVRTMKSRGSVLVRPPTAGESRTNNQMVPLFHGTSTISCTNDFQKFVRNERAKEWLKHFKTCDPRFRILKFFNDVANEGATGESVNFKRDHVSPLLKYFSKSSVFTVWRPTSQEAIRRMMLGDGVGKGLDIKGKSAKRGKLSAFVPFLQIHHEADKAKIRTLRKNGKIRVFFNSQKDRDQVVANLNEIAKEMEDQVRRAKHIVHEADTNDNCGHDEDTIEAALAKLTLDMEDSTIHMIDTYANSNKYGMEVPERLFWEGMVVRQSIIRAKGSRDDVGRSSMPSFQDMNFDSLRKPKNNVPGGHTRAVIMQCNPKEDEGKENDPMSPLNLVMAYEENDPTVGLQRIIPVVSDFDCFIVGTRNVKYEEPVPEDQLDILKWMVKQTEGILKTESPESWTKRWLDVLKDCGSKGYHPKIPVGGYADPKTRFIFKHAINRLSITGAVRHGAECFNYFFPQELDEKLLVISDQLPEEYKGRNWVYVDQDELKDILKYKIRQGFTFPLNPKWVLCDPGWKEVYDEMMISNAPNVQQALDCWYPPDSGIRESIARICKAHPTGFNRIEDHDRMRMNKYLAASFRYSNVDGTAAMDLAKQELKYYLILQRAKKRLKAYLLMQRMLSKIRDQNRNQNECNSLLKDESDDQSKRRDESELCVDSDNSIALRCEE